MLNVILLLTSWYITSVSNVKLLFCCCPLAQRVTHLVINRIKLGQDDAINQPRLRRLREVSQRLVKLHQLVHSLVADESLAHKQHQVRLVNFHKLITNRNGYR